MTVALSALVLAPTAGASARDNWRVHLTPAAESAAHTALLTAVDLDSAHGWTGRTSRVDPTSYPGCATLHPKLSDLVIEGDAGTQFNQAASDRRIWDEAVVFRTSQMVRLFWQRTVGKPEFLACLRATYRNAATVSERIESVRLVPLPQIASYRVAVRAIIANRKTGKTTLITLMIVARARTIVTVGVAGMLSSAAADQSEQIALTRRIVGRIRT
jgi:hypothetical protein